MSSYENTSQAFDDGLAVRRQVMGDDFVDRALSRTDGTESAEMQRFVTEHVWDAVWNRPGLPRRDRSLLNLGILTALRAHEELAGHVRGALNNGLSRGEIVGGDRPHHRLLRCAGGTLGDEGRAAGLRRVVVRAREPTRLP